MSECGLSSRRFCHATLEFGTSHPSLARPRPSQVYQPCVLLTKKRYAGYMYESASQLTPTFDAKGIETVRRLTTLTNAHAVPTARTTLGQASL